MKNEKTSKRVASIAGRIMRIIEQFEMSEKVEVTAGDVKLGTVADISSMAGSILTQTADRPKVRKK